MIKVTQVAEDGTETASIEVDDFTIEVIYAGLAEMLREAARIAGSGHGRRPAICPARPANGARGS